MRHEEPEMMQPFPILFTLAIAIEQDHQEIKRGSTPMQGLKSRARAVALEPYERQDHDRTSH